MARHSSGDVPALFVSPTPKRFINASKVVSVVFNEMDISVPDAMSDGNILFLRLERLENFCSLGTDLIRQFFGDGRERATESASCVELVTNCCTAGNWVALMLNSSVCQRSIRRHLLAGHKVPAPASIRVWAISRTAGSMPESGSIMSRLNTLPGLDSFGRVCLPHLGGKPYRARREHVLRQRVLLEPGVDPFFKFRS